MLNESVVERACDYSFSNGGKRIRPALLYGAALAVNPAMDLAALDYPACAIEMIHTYSLIHDDLPCIDNDDLRRGKPSCHREFDEATAILAGDALQCRAFEVVAGAPGLSDQQRLSMVSVMARSAGPAGMIAGQAIDIAGTGQSFDLTQLQNMHRLKTGALIQGALLMGGIGTMASAKQLAALQEYGHYSGLAFQVVDDILDVEGSTEILGKTQGKDSDANKPTYVKLLGAPGAKREAQQLLTKALTSLDEFGESAHLLRDIAHYIVERKH